MTPTQKQIVLSVSAMATIVSTLAQVAEQGEQPIALHDRHAPAGSDTRAAVDFHMDGIRTPFTGVAAEAAYRRHMGPVFDHLTVDQESMAESWTHLATFNNLGGVLVEGTGTGESRRNQVLGHQSDSTTTEGYDYLQPNTRANALCYNNCHSACHGSRGWR